MKLSKFFVAVGVLFVVALIVYVTTTPHGSDILLTGIVTGNDVIVSPQVAGRMIRLSVDEGSEVHKGDLIAELDPAELAAARDSAAANIRALEAKVNSVQGTRSWTDDQTNAALRQAEASLTATRSQLTQAQANLWRDQQTSPMPLCGLPMRPSKPSKTRCGRRKRKSPWRMPIASRSTFNRVTC